MHLFWSRFFRRCCCACSFIFCLWLVFSVVVDDVSLAVVPQRFFVEALVGLSEQLGELSSKKRAKGLQEGLERINEFFLSDRAQGSDVIYVPFGGGFHQA